MAVQVVQEIAQAVVAERDASLLGAFAPDDDESTFAVKVTQPQITELAKPNAGIIEEPEDSAIPGGCAIGKLARPRLEVCRPARAVRIPRARWSG